ncbi:hypothetical protein EON64_03175, partial [archaeon]
MPTVIPSMEPTVYPTALPSQLPTVIPSMEPTVYPTVQPSQVPTVIPSMEPTVIPSMEPTVIPSMEPTVIPSMEPTVYPTVLPSPVPAVIPIVPKETGVMIPVIDIQVLQYVMDISSANISVVFRLYALQPGQLFCAAFAPNYVLPSVDHVFAHGMSSIYDLNATKASVILTSLVPSTSYDVYCALRGFNKAASEYNDTLATLSLLTTLCCKTISWVQPPSFFYNSPTLASIGRNVFSFALSAAPSTSLQVRFYLYAVNNNNNVSIGSNYSLSPSTVSFVNSSLLSASFSCVPNVLFAGSYLVALQLAGPSTDEYYSVASLAVEVVKEFAPQPQVSYGVLSDSGTFAIVVFDSPTNRAQLVDTNWLCSILFVFDGADTTTCSWTNSSAIQITIPSYSESVNITGGRNIGIFLNLIGPECASSTCTTTAVATSARQSTMFSLRRKAHSASSLFSFVIRPPAQPKSPAPVLIISAYVLSCVPFDINPTQSTGSSNRPWAAVEWVVSSASSFNSSLALQTYLKSFGKQTSRIISVPAEMLDPGQYFVTLTLTNVMGSSASVFASFTTIQQSSELQSVLLQGPNQMIYKASQFVLLTTLVKLWHCNSSVSPAASSYTWTVLNNNQVQPAILSISLNPSAFQLPPYSLSPGTTYVVQVAVSLSLATGAVLTSSNNASITVINGDVVAIISGGSTRLISQDTSLSSAESYDENTKASTALFFQWSCKVISTANHGSLCTSILGSSNLLSDTVFVLHGSLLANTTYEVSVAVSALDGRYASTSVAVIKQNTVDIGANTAIKSIFQVGTIDFPMAVYGYVQAPVPILAAWTAFVGDRSLDLQQMSTTPVQATFSRNYSISSIPYPLSLRVQDVVKGSKMTFRLSSYDQATNRLLSYSDINVVAAPSPVGGSLVVSPSTGIGLTVLFTFVTSDWVDDSDSSLPLQYDFRYINPSQNAALTFQALGPSTVATSALPPGIPDDAYLITVIARAFNSLNAYGAVSQAIVVSERPAAISLSSYLNDGLTNARATNNTDAAISVVNNVLSVLSETNCSLASLSYCSSLNRSPCRTVSQTCGSCLTGYNGVANDANTLCSPVSNPLSPIGSFCSTNSSCFYGLCVEGLCTEPVQTCPSTVAHAECSGHGQCLYRANQLLLSSRCGIFNTKCIPSCSCLAGYEGDACQFSQEAAVERIKAYNQSCEALSDVASLSTLSASLLDTLSSSLFITSGDPLSLQTSGICVATLVLASEIAGQGYLNNTADPSPGYLFSTISNFISPGQFGADLDSALTLFAQGVVTTMTSGAYARQFSTAKLQLSVHRNAGTVNSLSVPLPRTSAEIQYNTPPITFSFVNDSLSNCDIGNSYTRFSLGAWNVVPFVGNSTPISPMMRIETYPNLTSSWSPTVSSSNDSTVRYTFNMSFSSARAFTKKYNADGLNTTFPSCKELSLEGNGNSQYVACPSSCKVSLYTNDTVVFACSDMADICPTPAMSMSQGRAQEARELSDTTGDDDAGQLNTPVLSSLKQMTAVLEYTQREFVAILSMNPFAIDVESAKVVMSLVGSILVVVAVGFVVFVKWDYDDHNKIMYLPREDVTKKRRAKQSLIIDKKLKDEHLQNLLEILDFADFAEQEQVKEKVELNHAEVTTFLDQVFPPHLKASSMWEVCLSFSQVAYKRHEMTSVFAGKSLSNPRYLRWLTFCISMLVMIFFDTLFFSIFFPDSGKCQSFDNAEDCTKEINMASGAALCSWSSKTVATVDVEKYENAKCVLNPPPNDLSFTLIVAMITFIVNLPIVVMLEYLKTEVCARRPDFESLGIRNQLRYFSSTPEDLGDQQEKTSLERLFRETFSHLEQHRVTGGELGEEAFISRRAFDEQISPEQEAQYLSQQSDQFFAQLLGGGDVTPWMSPSEYFHLQSKGRVWSRLLPPSLLRNPSTLFASIRQVRRRARRIRESLGEGQGEGAGESGGWEESIYLLQYFLLEQFPALSRYALQSQLSPPPTLSPQSIHGLAWLAGWTTLVSIVLFCIYWVLAWGVANGGRTLTLWGVNFAVLFAQEYIGCELLHLYLVFVVAMRRVSPVLHAMRTVMYRVSMEALAPLGLKKEAKTGEAGADGEVKMDDQIEIVHHLSPACRTAQVQYFLDLPSARILRHLKDTDVDVWQQVRTSTLSPLGAACLSLPVLLSLLLGGELGEGVAETTVPLLLGGFVLANYYAARFSVFLLVALYV